MLWIWAFVGPCVGFVVCYFIIKNNPEWLDLQKKVKESL